MNKRKTLSIATVLSLSLSGAYAQAQDGFQAEFSVSTALNDSRGDLDRNDVATGFRWYADRVSQQGPWKERGFLSRSSYYDVNYGYDNAVADPNRGFAYHSTSNNFGIGGRQFLGSSGNLFLDANYTRSDFRQVSSFYSANGSGRQEFSSDDDFFSLGIGRYLNDKTAVSYTVSGRDMSLSSSTHTVNFKTLSLPEIGAMSQGFDATVSYFDSEYSGSVFQALLGYSLYPTDALAIQINGSIRDVEEFSKGDDVILAGLNVSYAFAPNQAIELGTSFALNGQDDFFEASEVLGVEYSLRF